MYETCLPTPPLGRNPRLAAPPNVNSLNTAPFLATVIVLSLASGGLLQGLAGFLVFSLSMASLMVLVSVVASSSRRRLLKNLGESTPKIKKAGGAVIVPFGALLILLSLLPGILRPLFP